MLTGRAIIITFLCSAEGEMPHFSPPISVGGGSKLTVHHCSPAMFGATLVLSYFTWPFHDKFPSLLFRVSYCCPTRPIGCQSPEWKHPLKWRAYPSNLGSSRGFRDGAGTRIASQSNKTNVDLILYPVKAPTSNSSLKSLRL